MIRHLFFVLILTSLSSWSRAQEPIGNPMGPIADPQASVSLVLIDFVTGQTLDAYQPDTRLCPASVWKLATTAAAMDILGADFRFRTLLATRGTVENGTLHGDLIIVGGGDPSLGSRHFSESMEDILSRWVRAVGDLGIDSITGDVVANDAHFRGVQLPRTRIWEDMGNYYGTAVSGLNFNDNTYFVSFAVPAAPGDTAVINEIYPAVPHLDIRSEVLASPVQSDLAFIFGSPLGTNRVVRGTLPAGRDRFTIKGSLPDPALFTAFHLSNALRNAGVAIGGEPRTESRYLEPATYRVIDTHQSPSLSQLVRHTNSESDNLFAEAFLLQMGAHDGLPTIPGGLEALDRYYSTVCQSEYPFFAYDGSGLSRFTAISARQVVRILRMIRQSPSLSESVLAHLPLAGREGSMKWFAMRTNLAGNLRAKSGSMDKVRAYAGYFTAFSGREIAFAILVNNFESSGTAVRKDIEDYLIRAYGKY